MKVICPDIDRSVSTRSCFKCDKLFQISSRKETVECWDGDGKPHRRIKYD